MTFRRKQSQKQRRLRTYRRYTTAVGFELAVLAVLLLMSYLIWNAICGSSWRTCLGDASQVPKFFFYSFIRPLTFTPFFYLATISTHTFGLLLGSLLASLGAALSTAVLFYPARYVGERLVGPWVNRNLPETYHRMAGNELGVTILGRLVPFVPFDLVSAVLGVLDFDFRKVLLGSFIGTLPLCFSAYAFGHLQTTVDSPLLLFIGSALFLLACLLAASFVWSFFFGYSVWARVQNFCREAVYELHVNNRIDRSYQYDGSRPIVVLLYGFFSSRRALILMEKRLSAKGHQVMTFNLGGMLGILFTRGIVDTADFLANKIKRQIERYDFPEVQYIGYSKGGLVAAHYLFHMHGFEKRCKKLITLGTPFSGAYQTYLALVTPLAFFWRDVWQMRPGSVFLEEIADVSVPKDMKIHCLFSEKDRFSRGRNGIFRPRAGSKRVTAKAMHQCDHFAFLTDSKVFEYVHNALLEDNKLNLTNQTEATQTGVKDTQPMEVSMLNSVDRRK